MGYLPCSMADSHSDSDTDIGRMSILTRERGPTWSTSDDCACDYSGFLSDLFPNHELEHDPVIEDLLKNIGEMETIQTAEPLSSSQQPVATYKRGDMFMQHIARDDIDNALKNPGSIDTKPCLTNSTTSASNSNVFSGATGCKDPTANSVFDYVVMTYGMRNMNAEQFLDCLVKWLVDKKWFPDWSQNRIRKAMLTHRILIPALGTRVPTHSVGEDETAHVGHRRKRKRGPYKLDKLDSWTNTPRPDLKSESETIFRNVSQSRNHPRSRFAEKELPASWPKKNCQLHGNWNKNENKGSAGNGD